MPSKKWSVNSKYLSISTRGGNYRIPIDTILYIESNNRRLIIHTAAEEYSCYETLNEMEQHLSQSAFIRCHQSYLAAIDQITGYDNQCITLRDTNVRIPVSRQYQKTIREFLQRTPSGGTLICTCGIYQGSIIRIKPEQRVFIGRSGSTADIVINLPMVSRIHCEITYHETNREYVIIDYSSNGTFINGNTRLVPKHVYILKPETEISFGDPLTKYKLM